MEQLPIIERAKQHAKRNALITRSGSYTYQNLLRESESIASTLLDSQDDLREACVAFLLPAGFEYITTQWAIWRAGGIAVPLSLAATDNEIEYTLTDSQCRKVISNRELSSKISSVCERLGLQLILVDDLADANSTMPDVSVTRRAMILYTSGTTSKPKGVVTTHACIRAQIESLITAWHWELDDRIPLFLPLHHIHGIINIMSCALWSGATIEPFAKFDIESVLQRVQDDAYTVFMAVPTIYVKLIEHLKSLSPTQRQLITDAFGKMRLMISGSAALPASVHEAWTSLTGQRLLERYGMTEIGMALSNPYDGERRAGSVGQPLPGVTVRLYSEDGSEISEEGIAGEIQVRGPNVFQEYWNRPEITRDSFVDGWFQTGDIAVIEDGYFRIMGRNSVDIIKSGGYKLSALEIEAALLDHESIAQCAVVGVPDDKWGECVAVAVVVTPDERLQLGDLQDWCKDRISTYKIPRKLVVVESLPRNAMGKVTKPDVLKLF